MATVVQIPPPVGSSGQFIDVVNISSSTLREIVVIGSPVTSSHLAPVTSTGGLRVSLSTEDGNIIRIAGGTTQVAPVSLIDGLLVEVSNPDFFALTSGVVTLSSVHTFVLSSVSVFPANVNVTLTSTGGIVAPVTSSGGLLVTVTGTGFGASSTAVNIIGTSSAIAPVTSSGGLGVTILGGAGSGSTAVNLVGSSNGIGPVTTSGGLLVTIVAGAGAGSTAVNIIGTSSAIGPVTSSGGQLVALSNPASLALTSGTVTLSSAIALSSGTVTLSSNPTVVSASSGLVQISGIPTVIVTTSAGLGASNVRALSSGTVTLSSVHTVTATAATNPWSSAPSFNVPIVSVSSGLVQIAGTVATVSASSGVVQVQLQTSDARLVFGYVSSSSANANLITGSPAGYYGYEVFNTTGQLRFVHFYHTSSVPGIGTTANWIHSAMVPYSTAGGGGAISVDDRAKSYSTKGLGFTITDGPSSTSTGSVGNNDVLLSVYYKT